MHIYSNTQTLIQSYSAIHFLSAMYLWWSFMYLVFTRIPGKSYRRRLRSLLLYLGCVFLAKVDRQTGRYLSIAYY